MKAALRVVDRLLEADDLDWSPDPGDPDASMAPIEHLKAGIVDKAACLNAHHGQWFYHKADGIRAKVNGRCKTWKRTPERFSLPVKYGLYAYFYITQDNASEWSTQPVEKGLI